MKTSEYSKFDGMGLAELIRDGEVSPKEVAIAAIRAIEGLNPALNAVLEVYHDRLQGLSDIAEKQADDAGPFANVPMLLKDIGATEAGRKQEMGSPLMKGRVAKESSYLMQKFEAAGLVNLGRTALPEFGMASLNTVSNLHGATVNPWDTNYMSGSSSGGAGAAVASGMVPIAHASDIGGSTRHPSGICGAVGLKASRGRISPGPERFDFPLGTLNEFAITRTVRDCAALLDAIEGPGHGEVRCVERPSRPYLQEVLDIQAGQALSIGQTPWRVAICDRSFCHLDLDAEVAKAVTDTGKALQALGAEANSDKPDFDFTAMMEADAVAVGAYCTKGLYNSVKSFGVSPERDKISPVMLGYMDVTKDASALDLLNALEQYNQTRRAINVFFERYDLLILPILSCQTERSDLHTLENGDFTSDDWMNHIQYLLPFNISGHPSLSLPLGVSTSNMPIGVQLVARFGAENTLMRAAAALEQAMPWSNRIPPNHASRL